MTLNVIQGHRHYRYLIGHILLTISGLEYQRTCTGFDVIISIFTAFMTACGLEKSFSFDKVVETTSHMRFPIHV